MTAPLDAPDQGGDREAVLQAARDFRLRQQIPEALALLAQLQARHPRFSRLYQERGHCHVLERDAAAAVEALQEAVRLNPTLPASWDMLQQLYRLLGDPARAAGAAQQLTMLRRLPPEVVAANSLYADGDLAEAEAILQGFLRQQGDNAGARRLLARIHFDRHELGRAETQLEALLAQAPDYHEARLDYAMVLLQQQKHHQARQQAEHLLRHDPANRDYLKQYAAACVGLGDHEPVIGLYGRLLAEGCRSRGEAADLHLWRANALKVVGRREEAIVAYRASLAARPGHGVAWFSLANLKTYRFTDEDIAAMRDAAAQPEAQEMDLVYLNYALGKALEDRADYRASWRFYESGAALRRTASRYRPDVAEACALRLKRVFTAEVFAERRGWGAPDAAPIFVVGLPRSGSTLVEQILASHSAVEGTQELSEIDRYAAELCGRDPDCRLPQTPEALLALTADQALALGTRYLRETAVYRRLGRPHFIDKMPNNFWHIGLIHLILPQAKIIDVRREPMACGFSNLKQLFGADNQEFTYGVGDMARHYRIYLDLMRHWDAVLPRRVFRAPYEDVVEDLEPTVRRLLHHCGLAFEPGCLTFHETQRSVRTPSSEQVRQPLGREGLVQWKHYAPWLGPLRDELGDALTTYRL
jgi:tetratricopeptide (TPR) repeat protein